MDASIPYPPAGDITPENSFSIFRRLFISMLGFGMLVGLVFPPFARFVLNTERALSPTFFILCILAGFVVGLSNWWLVSGQLIRPVKTLMQAAGKMSEGDLDCDLVSHSRHKGEIGSLFTCMYHVTSRLEEITEFIQKVASGDLTVTIQPASDQDVLGNSCSNLVSNLRRLVQGIAENAASLSQASQQLSQAATSSDTAANQISNVMQQVTLGVNQEVAAVTRTNASMDQMSNAIERVAQSAVRQAQMADHAMQVGAQIESAIQEVNSATENSVKRSVTAGEAAGQALLTVKSTVDDIQGIYKQVNHTANIVGELDGRTKQIGAIVETIHGIASQTNLLALNAAIEAARAGAHGKGFAVVADEVRKLAEKAAISTGEINSLVMGIQSIVKDAVQAMQASIQGIEKGISGSGESRQALEKIQDSLAVVTGQIKTIAGSIGQITTVSGQLVGSMETVRNVVLDTQAVSTEMEASSLVIIHAMENIASVSEENSAVIEEVCASTQDMSEQVEGVAASARLLAEMSQALMNMISQFHPGTPKGEMVAQTQKRTMLAAVPG